MRKAKWMSENENSQLKNQVVYHTEKVAQQLIR